MPQSRKNRSAIVTRRALLCAVSALSVLAVSNAPMRAFAANMDVDGFLALSQRVLDKSGLSQTVASGMLQAFTASGREAGLVALAEGEADDELEAAIVSSWYTGLSPDPSDLQVLTYTDALIWRAMDYTKPMAFCGGGVGYWADPPEA